MSIPRPVPGQVIRYSFLWWAEHQRGQEEGLKDRPCAVVFTTVDADGDQVVTVLPVTHTPPPDPAMAVEIPRTTKRRLGLDEEQSWIVLTEANEFVWPGPDLRPAHSGNDASVLYGLLPAALFDEVRDKFAAAFVSRRVKSVPRTE